MQYQLPGKLYPPGGVRGDAAPGLRRHQTLHEKSGLGNDFLGWVDLPTNYDKAEFERIKAAAKKIQQQSKVLVVIGIGGSYLGARAAIEYIKSNNTTPWRRTPRRSTLWATPSRPAT